MKTRILLDCVASGQPRPYADTIYVYEVTFEYEQSWGPNKGEWLPRQNVDKDSAILAVKSVKTFKTLDQHPEWHETQLSGVEQLADNKFKVSLVQEYTG